MSCQIEHLRPHQIAEALEQRSLVYLPLGTIEWHCHHLPVGLDALTAHGVCRGAADKAGGLVWPPLYYGTGGDHGQLPWTVMMEDQSAIRALLDHTLARLSELGVEQVVLFSGHFAPEQLDMIADLADHWNQGDRGLRVHALSVNRSEVPNLPPDHAGVFESTLISALAPQTVDLSQLGDEADSLDRFDPDSPLWGVVGADPRNESPLDPAALLEHVVDWLVDTVS